MLESYKTLLEGGTAEIVEKKSRFIATVRLVESEEEALTFIEEMKKKILGCTSQLLCVLCGNEQGIYQMQ